jgi:transglutaminase-like putative cysteine protease
MEGIGMNSQRIERASLATLVLGRIGAATGLSLLLLLVSLNSVAYGLTLVVRGLSLDLALGLASAGLGAGWLLARSRLKAGWSAGLAALLGMASLLLHLGGLFPDLFILLKSMNQLGVGLIRDPLNDYRHLNQAKSTLEVWGDLWDKLSVILARLSTFIAGWASGNPSYDPLVTILLWSLALWGAAVWAAWAVRRQSRSLAAVAPGGILLAASLGYARANPSALLFLLGSALLLIILVQHLSRQRRWDEEGTDYSEELSLDIAMIAIPMAAMIVSVAAFAPNVSPRRISQMVQEALRVPQTQLAELGDSLGLRRQTLDSSLYEDWRNPGMPRSHLIGYGPELSQEVMLEIQPTQIQILPEAYNNAPFKTARLNYWRSRTYDIYTGHGWMTGRPETIAYRAGELARPPGSSENQNLAATGQSQAIVIQEIKIFGAQDPLYVAGTILTADQDYQIAWRRSAPSAGPDIFGGSIAESRYRVRSLVTIPDQDQLRVAGSDYPQGIRERYLTLPESIPQRVHALALQLTATQSNPYDRALAIESYLRSFPYALDVPLPPPSADAVDYFLFDLQQGYCDYYATAMVVLARAAGIPARLVMGYAGGSYDIDRDVTVVTEADAHSWVEVYFTEIGWVEFEPTGGRPGLDSPEHGAPAALSVLEEEPFPTSYPSQAAWIWLLGLCALPGIIVLSFIAWQWVDGWRLKALPAGAVVTQIYWRFYKLGKLITASPVAGETPYEFAARFASVMEQLTTSKRWGKQLVVSTAQVDHLTDLYTWTVYSPHPTSQADQKTAIQVWQQMRWRLWVLRFSARLISKN